MTKIAGVVVLTLATANVAGTQPPPTFHSQINLVQFAVVATDAHGNPIRNLTKDDFQILDDGHNAQIAAFAASLPPDATASDSPRRTIPSDIATTDWGHNRVVAIVLDEYHVERTETARVKTAAHDFVERVLAPADYVAVFHTAGGVGENQLFTQDRRLIGQAIDRFIGQQSSVSTMDFGAPAFDGASSEDTSRMQARTQLRAAMETLRQLAERMSASRGRRQSIVWFSGDVSTERDARATSVIDDSIQSVLSAAAAADVSIYAIDPRAPSSGQADVDRQAVRIVTDETGGFAAARPRDLMAALNRIATDNSEYYIVGFVPRSESQDRRVHRLEVRATRPDVIVRFHKAYVGPSPDRTTTAARVAEGIRNLVPVEDFPFSAQVLAMKDLPQRAGLLALIDVPASYFQRAISLKEGTDALEVAIGVVDSRNRIVTATRHTYDLTLAPETRAAAQRDGMRLVSQLAVPAGHYQVRIAIVDSNLSTLGSVIADADVPDFFKTPVTLSGIAAFVWPFNASAPAFGDAVPLLGAFPWPPTLRRELFADETLALFGEIYQSAALKPRDAVTLAISIRDDAGRAVREYRELEAAGEPTGHRGELGFQYKLSLAELAPAFYTVRIEAHAEHAPASVAREFPILIKPRP